MHSSLKKWRIILNLVEGKVSMKIIGIYPFRRFVYSPIYLFIQSFIYRSTDSWELILCVIIQHYFSYFDTQIVPGLALVSVVFCAPSTYSNLHDSWSTSLLSSTVRYTRLILCISCPSPRISHVSEEPWFLLLENGIRNQDLSTRYTHCCWF